MNPESRLIAFGWSPHRLRARELICIAIAVFSGTLITGIGALIAAMASICVLAPVNRCFSMSRDAVGAISLGVHMWLLPAVVVALLIALIVRLRKDVSLWTVLGAVAGTMAFYIALMSARGAIALAEAGFFFIVGSVILFVGVQLSLFVSRYFIRLGLKELAK